MSVPRPVERVGWYGEVNGKHSGVIIRIADRGRGSLSSLLFMIDVASETIRLCYRSVTDGKLIIIIYYVIIIIL